LRSIVRHKSTTLEMSARDGVSSGRGECMYPPRAIVKSPDAMLHARLSEPTPNVIRLRPPDVIGCGPHDFVGS
jgi:hypothetical protein